MFTAILFAINWFVLGLSAAVGGESKSGDDDHDPFIPCC